MGEASPRPSGVKATAWTPLRCLGRVGAEVIVRPTSMPINDTLPAAGAGSVALLTGCQGRPGPAPPESDRAVAPPGVTGVGAPRRRPDRRGHRNVVAGGRLSE